MQLNYKVNTFRESNDLYYVPLPSRNAYNSEFTQWEVIVYKVRSISRVYTFKSMGIFLYTLFNAAQSSMALTGKFRYLPAYQNLGFPSSIRFTHDSFKEWAKSTNSTSWIRMNRKAPHMPITNQAINQNKKVILYHRSNISECYCPTF